MNFKVGDIIYNKYNNKKGRVESVEEDFYEIAPLDGSYSYGIIDSFILKKRSKSDLVIDITPKAIDYTIHNTKFKIGDKIRNINTGSVYEITGINAENKEYITNKDDKTILFEYEDLYERINAFKVGDTIYYENENNSYYIYEITNNVYKVKHVSDFGEFDEYEIDIHTEGKYYTKEKFNITDFKEGDVIRHKFDNIKDIFTITETTPDYYICDYIRWDDKKVFSDFLIEKSKSSSYEKIDNVKNNDNMKAIFKVGDVIVPKSFNINELFKNGVTIKEIANKAYIIECKTEYGMIDNYMIPITECETNYELKNYDNNLKYMPISSEPVNEKYEKVNHPKHYNSHPSGVECVDIIKYMDTPTGNVIKYLWRLGLKPEEGYTQFEKDLEDAEKARWWIDIKIGMIKEQLEKQKAM